MADDDGSANIGDPQLRFDSEAIDGTRVLVTLAGRFDVVEAMTVRERLAEPGLVGARHLVIDLSAVTFIDSAGLAVLARARRDRVNDGGSVVLVRPATDAAMRVFRLTQFDQIFPMVDRFQRGAT